MKERGLVLIGVFFLIMVSGFALAQLSEYGDEFGAATQCLDNEIRTASSLTLEEAVYSILAGSDDSRPGSTINELKHASENCWPAGGCTIKSTAQVALAKQANGENIEGILDWLKNKTATPSDLLWYLQITIDGNKEASCEVSYDGSSHTVTVNSDLTLSGDTGTCLDIDNNDFWLKISPSCVDKEFSIGCDWSGEGSENDNFLTNLVYQETPGGTTFVSSDTGSSPNGGFSSQQVEAKCFTTGGGCDYEGSLWATTALHNANEETTKYVPYLLGLKDSNLQYFPSAFLTWILGQGNNGEQYNDVYTEAEQGHWYITGGYSRFIDTGLAMIAFGGGDASEIVNFDTLGWLFSQTNDEGCFNNDIRDTAFIVYAAQWRGATGNGGGGGGGGPPAGLPEQNGSDGNFSDGGDGGQNYLDDCELEGYYCGDRLACITGGGQAVDQYSCLSFSETCCTVQPPALNTCGNLGGEICAFDEECSSATTQAEDGACCVQGACKEIDTSSPGPGPSTPSGSTEGDEEGTSIWVWVIILVILIGLAVLALIYRDKIRMWIFKRKGKVKTSQVGAGSSSFGPVASRRPPPRFGPPTMARGLGRPQPRRPVGRNDKEMEDTLKKLKEMSK